MLSGFDLKRVLEITTSYNDCPHPCISAFIALSTEYNTVGWYNGNHVITEIDGTYYDNNGKTELGKYYLPLKEYGKSHIFKSFYLLQPHEIELLEILL